MRTIPVRVATASAVHIHGMKRSLRAIAVPEREAPQTRKSIMTTDDSTIPIDRMCTVCIIGTSQVIRRIAALIGKLPTHCESSAIIVVIDRPSTVMPALVAGIHVFLAGLQQSQAWMAGTSPAMTPEK
jgi:hypothetical protein